MTVKTTTTHTVESIKALLSTSNAAVERALVVLYEYQTADEQSSEETKHTNGVGFNAVDAQILSSFACQISRKVGQFDDYLKRDRKLGECLSPKQMTIARNKVSRYAKQLCTIANGKAQPEQAKPEAFGYWLMRQDGRKVWEQLTEAQAAKWHERMVILVKFNRLNVNVKAFDQAEAGTFWLNTVGDLLQVLAQGEQPDLDKWARQAAQEELAHQAREQEGVEVAKRINELAAQGRYEDAAQMAHEFALDIELEMEEVEVEQGWHQGHSAKTSQADPEARTFRAARNQIANWIAK